MHANGDHRRHEVFPQVRDTVPLRPSTDRITPTDWRAVTIFGLLVLVQLTTTVTLWVAVRDLRQVTSHQDSERNDDYKRSDEDRKRSLDRVEQDRRLNESRKEMAVQQAGAQIAADRNRKVAEDNLRLSEELNRRLRDKERERERDKCQ